MFLWFADQNTITKNVISYNNGSGIELIASDSNTIIENIIINNRKHGIYLWQDYPWIADNTVSANIIKDNERAGIVMAWASNTNVTGNNLENDGIYLYFSQSNLIIKNNFRPGSATFDGFGFGHSNNIWNGNYWNRPRFLPKLIIGWVGPYFDHSYYPLFPWFEVDRHPAQEPYDIGV